jgi:hypothetical protein
MRSNETNNMDKYILSIGNSVNGEKDWSSYFADYKSNVFFGYKLYPQRGDISITYTIYIISKAPDIVPINEHTFVYGTAKEIADYMARQCPSVPEEFVDEFSQMAITHQRDSRLGLILG